MKIVAMDNSKRHMTNAEKNKRIEAEKALERKKVNIRMPTRLKENKTAAAHWKMTVKRMNEIGVLDDLDTDTLAIYCETLARYDQLESLANDDPLDMAILRGLQAQSRLIIQYAEKLALTPESRARLAKKRAEKEDDPNADLFD